MNNYMKIFTNGLLKENPLLILMIGLCSGMAITTTTVNGLGMGLAMTFVIVMSEGIISLFRKLIPNDIRIPVFIIVIAAFTTIVDLSMQAFTPELSASMGVFIPLIVVNCIIMGRVESFSSKESVGKSVIDALGMGIGYTWVLVAISFIRELLGAGAILGHVLYSDRYFMKFFSNPPGGFFVFAVLISATYGFNDLVAYMKKKKIENALQLQAAERQAAAATEQTGSVQTPAAQEEKPVSENSEKTGGKNNEQSEKTTNGGTEE
ncbi:electron transport complex subunit E [Treponema phagedenis]|uniref:Ion-translocating oxidoreductase complex subunit E n=1 Tax=Treponema phagedenis TaxID=162 RepID=A0A0B7GRE1_TREPH|nr:electron transport complex subunit E [Treponema phagedenis]EFW37502.1 electron transport complex, RnfABCDGE type, E subunit [Treponema phagedenis F0421]NVP24748.1 electron transport complex subunit E [Treponema phagedenis]QEJ95861.1 electron transport complex subunit E [Treponema phagedenis]QEJ98864.1 electron transport complex subunit E [Treponema phagedenis]QEK00443.1 electron transport complex subunit E [Treponema phagedenis]